ncbi:MAG: rod shape-determining protein RodA [Verrucomicrobiota bacterium]
MFQTSLNERESQIQWPMILALLGLMAIGGAFVYSATANNEAIRQAAWYRQPAFKQLVFYVLGVAAGAAICLVNYRRLARWSLVIYWISILFLIVVLIEHIGIKVGGARRWINFGFFNFQPSEFAKIACILAQAHFLSRPAEELRFGSTFAKALGLTLLPFVLILKEPDLGSALVLLPISLVMMFAAGVPVTHLRRLVAGSGLLVAVILVDVLFAPVGLRLPLEPYQRDRLLVYFGRDFASRNAPLAERQRSFAMQQKKSYNVEQALISVGSGGLTGKGWRQGTQNALGYLPRTVAHNDFIFSVIAEEKGFLGSVTVITLYTVVLFTGIYVAGQARDRLGKLLAIGVVTMLFSHVFINIGMNIRLMPVTGIPLPLLSYGGTSVLCSLIAAGLLQNIYLHRDSY